MNEPAAQSKPSKRSRLIGSLLPASMIVILFAIVYFLLSPYRTDHKGMSNIQILINSLSIAVEQYHMRYRAYPPMDGPLVTNENKRSLHADISRNLHFYLGTPRPEVVRIDQHGNATYRINPPLFEFRDDQLEGGDAAALIKACASKSDVESVLRLIEDPAVRAAICPLVDPWGNRIWCGLPKPSPPPPPCCTKGIVLIQSMGPPDPDGGFSWFDPEHPERFPDNDVTNWRKPR